MKIRFLFMFIFLFLIIVCSNAQINNHSIPRLVRQGSSTHLIVDNMPFLILGGELGNSSFTSLEYMNPIWPKLKKMNLNTVLAPVYWELIEPAEGKFEFGLYDKLINDARKNNLKLVFLWFGSWKNSMSSHAPSWIKIDQKRFPRVKDNNGRSQEMLTPFSDENLRADIKAFQNLMKHIKEFDKNDHTVIMIQPENEIGMLPSARDYSPSANIKFLENVPVELMKYLITNKAKLVTEFYDVWGKERVQRIWDMGRYFWKGTKHG